MTSTIKVNNIQNQCGANIINENSDTITIGASGDTIALASGASQTGFGRTGTVDWVTTKKTASFTAVSGEGYFVDSGSSAITVTLPASPSANDIVSVSDYNGTASTNSITIARNGSNINGDAANLEISKADSAVTLVYVDATVGWTSVQTSNTADITNPFIVASGGTQTTCGDFKIHTFTGPGTFTVSNTGTGSNTVDYLVVAGGGGGGSYGAGGGGGGGFRESSGAASGCYTTSPLGACVSALPVTAQGYPITVGGGSSGAGPGRANASNGSNSVFSSITSAGGGGGVGNITAGIAGGSGGGGSGGAGPSTSNPFPGGAGNTPPVSPPQGNNGGAGFDAQSVNTNGGGGGGAGAAGSNASSAVGGNGAAGVSTSITGSSVTRAGGGGGGTDNGSGSPGGTAGTGGSGGGGNGNNYANPGNGSNGTANTGGGGGGGGKTPFPTATAVGGTGGSGIVIIRYKFQ